MIESYMLWVWLAVFIIAFIVEACTQDLVSIWFSVGALVSLILSIFDNIPYWVEIIVFVVVTAITFVLTRPLAKKVLKNQIRKTNVDEFVGKEVLALKDVTREIPGEVKINDVIYSAVLMPGENKIEANSYCEIVSISGNKLIVKNIKKPTINKSIGK